MKELLIIVGALALVCVGIGWSAGQIWGELVDLFRTGAEVLRMQWRALVRDHIIDDEPEDA